MAVAMIDIDGFKAINDALGHQAGDAVLRKLSEALRSTVREVDIIGRYGGEEFLVILVEPTKEIVIRVPERIRSSIESRSRDWLPGKTAITVSVGAALLSDPRNGSCDALIRAADDCLYAAKEGGKNCVRCVAL